MRYLICLALLLLSMAAFAQSDDFRLHAGLDEYGMPLVQMNMQALNHAWDGTVLEGQPREIYPIYLASDLLPDLEDVRSKLNLPTEPGTHIYITPSNSQPGQPRYVAVTRKPGNSFSCIVYERENLILISMLEPGSILTKLHGKLEEQDPLLDCHIAAIAQTSRRDLVVMLVSSYAGEQYSDLGIWNGLDWTPLEIPESLSGSADLSLASTIADPFSIDRLYVGPADEILYCRSDQELYYLANSGPGTAYSLITHYDRAAIAAQLGISLPPSAMPEETVPAGAEAPAQSNSWLLLLLGGLVIVVVIFLALRRSRTQS